MVSISFKMDANLTLLRFEVLIFHNYLYYARVERVYDDINASITKKNIHLDFQLNKLPLLISRVSALMGILVRI